MLSMYKNKDNQAQASSQTIALDPWPYIATLPAVVTRE